MWLLLSIIIIILGLLVFTLRGLFGIFPDSWEWVGIVLAGVGIVMGIPSILKMTLGQPKLLVNFERMTEDRKRTLAIFFKNPQLEKKSIWRKMGVRRDTIESFTVAFRISEVGTGKIIVPIMQSRIYSYDDSTDAGRNRIVLPPTFGFEACVAIAVWDENKKVAIISGDRTKSSVELSSGIYKITAIFTVDGEEQVKSRQFIVGETADALIWIEPNQSTRNK